MRYNKPIAEIIRERFSCRTYLDVPIDGEIRQRLEEACVSMSTGPFGTPVRFRLVAATKEDTDVLRGLGTYGFIQGATGFILGAVGDGHRNLEDFGYRLEQIILLATDLGLGTCWLGGTFTKSRFAARMGLGEDELMPCVVSVGEIAEKSRFVDKLIRGTVAANTRYPWGRLFFDGQFGAPLSQETAGIYAVPLEMVRLGPSAVNRQPWRIVKDEGTWHFFVQHKWGYREGNIQASQPVNLQRVDMGIALCHFELAAKESGLEGHWVVDDPGITRPNDRTEYTASWVED